MRGKKENENSSSPSLHRAVLEVSLDQRRRWTGAIWAERGDSLEVKEQLERLVVGTMLAQLSTRASDQEALEERFDSFDLLFYEAPSSPLLQSLVGEGWTPIEVSQLNVEEMERLTVFENEARREGLAIADGPAAMVRLEIKARQGLLEDRIWRAGQGVAKKMGDQLWGEQPGFMSKLLYDELRRQVQLKITPDEAGLAGLEDIVVEPVDKELWLPHPMVFQGLCDFIGVVLQARGDREVQWAPSVLDEQTGLWEAPLLRVRPRRGQWKIVPVGRDVVARLCVPWAVAAEEGERRLTALLRDYLA